MSRKTFLKNTFTFLSLLTKRKPFLLRGRHYCSSSFNRTSQEQNSVTFQSRIFSGIQPTGIPHIGNYLGAIKPWVDLQHRFDDVILSIVDLHSITVPHDPATLRGNCYDILACLLACGIDPDKCIIFKQSMVKEHATLAWIFSCGCTLPRLQHLPQWKEKSKQQKDVTVGLFTYPVLQAADILLYKGTHVPVGDDQLKHIELTRDLARAFNRKYGTVFPEPVEIIDSAAKIRSLKDPAVKMSKSALSERSRIQLDDPPDVIREKFKKAVSDMTSEITYDSDNRPGISNLIDIYSGFTGQSTDEVVENSLCLDTLDFKMRLADIVIEQTQPIRNKIEKYKSDRNYLDKILSDAQSKAVSIATETMNEVYKAVGFL